MKNKLNNLHEKVKCNFLKIKFNTLVHILKRALAVSLGTYVYYIIAKPDSPFYVAIAIYLCFDENVSGSCVRGKNRVLGTMIGAIVGLALSYYFNFNFFVIFLGLVFIMYLTNILDVKGFIPLAGIAFLYTMLHNDAVPKDYYSQRVVQTIFGVAVAIGINYIVYPLNHSKLILSEYENIIEFLAELIENHLKSDKKINLKSYEKRLTSFSRLIEGYIREPKSPYSKGLEKKKLEELDEKLKETLSYLRIMENLKNNMDKDSSEEDKKVYDYHKDKVLNHLDFYKNTKLSLEKPKEKSKSKLRHKGKLSKSNHGIL